MSDVAFTRTEMLSEQAPPASSVGIVGWLHSRLFSSWFNGFLTVIVVIALFFVLYELLHWALSPTWNGTSLAECRQILVAMGQEQGNTFGACWGVIRERWVQLIFGFYPSDLYWRPIAAFVLLGVALGPILFADRVPKQLIWFTAVYPFLFPWLLWGGAFWVPILVILGIVFAYLANKFLAGIFGNLGAFISAVVVAIVWWLILMPMVGNGLNTIIGSVRMESTSVRLDAEIVRLSAEEEALNQQIEELTDTIESEQAANESRYVDDPDGLLEFIREIGAKKEALAELHKQSGNLSEELSGADSLNRRIQKLPELEAQYPDALAFAEKLRSELPKSVAHVSIDTELEALLEEVREGKSNATLEDTSKVVEVLEAETKAKSLKGEIAGTYRDVALIGLQPVESRDFGGFMLSITIGVVAIACSLPLGIVMALGRQSDLMIVKYLCIGFIEFIRGVPLITLLIVASTLLNIFLPPGTNFDIILRVLIMVTLFASAYMAEVIRGGLAALPKGQYEGADSLGLDYWQSQRLIIMPQALKISIPGIVSTFIGVFKDTTLVSIIGLLDPLGLSTAIRASAAWNGVVWELYGFIALIFWIFCFSMSRYSMYLERKLQTGHR